MRRCSNWNANHSQLGAMGIGCDWLSFAGGGCGLDATAVAWMPLSGIRLRNPLITLNKTKCRLRLTRIRRIAGVSRYVIE